MLLLLPPLAIPAPGEYSQFASVVLVWECWRRRKRSRNSSRCVGGRGKEAGVEGRVKGFQVE
ncbi:hypothetical protein E2C01_099431 [Portunus trituberculatus]|uniref:Uncharacterized protein n=1 Tax=Portunus trituberculatus TaxID=210409 RepID=A0A5B7KAY6_PORTR|nr:hypothetical protein [Portunus trituberculatus]